MMQRWNVCMVHSAHYQGLPQSWWEREKVLEKVKHKLHCLHTRRWESSSSETQCHIYSYPNTFLMCECLFTQTKLSYKTQWWSRTDHVSSPYVQQSLVEPPDRSCGHICDTLPHLFSYGPYVVTPYLRIHIHDEVPCNIVSSLHHWILKVPCSTVWSLLVSKLLYTV